MTHWVIVLSILVLSATGLYIGHPIGAPPGAAGEFRTENYVFYSPAAYEKATGQKVGAYKESPILKAFGAPKAPWFQGKGRFWRILA